MHQICRRMRHLCIGRALFRVPYKGQLLFAWMPIDQKNIPRAHLRGGEQPRNRADYVALDGALQVACSISLVGALLQQELPSSFVIRNWKGLVAQSNKRFCTCPNSISSTSSSSSRFNGWNTTTLSKRFINSGENFRRAASTAVLSTFSFNPLAGMSFGRMKPIPPCINSVISPPPRFEVRKITVCDRATLRLSPK